MDGRGNRTRLGRWLSGGKRRRTAGNRVGGRHYNDTITTGVIDDWRVTNATVGGGHCHRRCNAAVHTTRISTDHMIVEVGGEVGAVGTACVGVVVAVTTRGRHSSLNC